jgi:hypothetical protein
MAGQQIVAGVRRHRIAPLLRDSGKINAAGESIAFLIAPGGDQLIDLRNEQFMRIFLNFSFQVSFNAHVRFSE